jgi:hypothetical protein
MMELQPGETAIDTWTLIYTPPGGGNYNGKLTVTNQRLLFDAIWDASVLGTLGNRAASGLLVIDKSDIAGLEVQKKFLSKKAILTLADGSVHVFNYGAMNIDKVVAAIEAR